MHAPVRTWPSLPVEEWTPTRNTLHMWTQIVGKIRLAHMPLINHWWEVTLYVTPRGLTTGAIPHRNGVFDMEFDFVGSVLFHQAVVDLPHLLIARIIRLEEPLATLLTRRHRMQEAAAVILHNDRADSLTVEGLNRLILYGAYDAGFDRPQEITSATLRAGDVLKVGRVGLRISRTD